MSVEDLLTTSEAAERYGKTRAAWRQACERGSVEGAMSKGGIWLIPRDAAVRYAATAKRGRPSSSPIAGDGYGDGCG